MESPNIIINKAKDIELAISAYNEFCDAADYIWKSPQLLENEREKEMDKLPVYFPGRPDLAEKRWNIESSKIEQTFPSLISRGNLFSIVSLFEAYLLLLAKKIEDATQININSARGQGASKINNYLSIVGIKFKSVSFFEQVDSALKIRNCLFHANGIIDWCKKPEQVIGIVDDLRYLSSTHKQRRKDLDKKFDEVTITLSKFGPRLEITNDYSFLVANYLRDYFVGLCIEANKESKI